MPVGVCAYYPVSLPQTLACGEIVEVGISNPISEFRKLRFGEVKQWQRKT